ncbi:phenazine biosynthesis protein PhzF [Bryobacterales bacterium F-183]|nr:phenazine biosynthesis protein PhzF [Bryobacterales bacterium F-183]
MARERPFRQVDVFSAEACKGNALAVVVDAEGLTDAEMQRFAAWTNLAETTFLLPPTDPSAADYKVRIFTTNSELPFAGHPTLGSCFAWLDTGGMPRVAGRVVQECGVGLVEIQAGHDGRLAFAAPPLTLRTVDEAVVSQFVASLGLQREDVLAASWLVNGPAWLGFLLRDAELVLGLKPNYSELREYDFGFAGAWPSGSHECAFEVRAFPYREGPIEDPVTGSFQAGLGGWLTAIGAAPDEYVAAQGTALGRAGRVYIAKRGERLWVGGDCTTLISGTVSL